MPPARSLRPTHVADTPSGHLNVDPARVQHVYPWLRWGPSVLEQSSEEPSLRLLLVAQSSEDTYTLSRLLLHEPHSDPEMQQMSAVSRL